MKKFRLDGTNEEYIQRKDYFDLKKFRLKKKISLI